MLRKKTLRKKNDENKPTETTDGEVKEGDLTAPAFAVVPVDVRAAGSAEAALAQFMASGNLAAATATTGAPPMPAVPPDPIWEQVDQVLKAPTCKKCLMPCSIENLVNKTKSEARVNVVCKGCNSATTMLSRHLGKWPVPAFTGMSQDQQVSFWKQCQDIIQKTRKA